MPRDSIQEIISYNRRFVGRYPDLLRQKIARMASGPFGFFRGTFHLFARDIIDCVLDPWQNGNPFTAVESCLVGDIHSENYGTYKGDQGTVRFDIDDFDETTHGSFDFDCKRAATSLFLATAEAGVPWSPAVEHVQTFLRTYAKSIDRFAIKGVPENVGYCETELPDVPALKKLIRQAADTSRSLFIEQSTVEHSGGRHILRTPKMFDLKAADRALAERATQDFIRRLPAQQMKGKGPHFFEIEDICGRVAGCGSLGRLRFAVLLTGDGSAKAKNVMLEIKESLPSAYDEYRGRDLGPDNLRHRAAEVVATQRAMQTRSSPWLGLAVEGDMSFQVKPLGPRTSRIRWETITREDDFEGLARVYAELLAKCHARADMGPGQPDRARLDIAVTLAGRVELFVKRVTAFALAYSEVVEEDQRRLVARRADVEQALLG